MAARPGPGFGTGSPSRLGWRWTGWPTPCGAAATGGSRMNDTEAYWWGWQITKTFAGVGRRYRDIRFETSRRARGARGGGGLGGRAMRGRAWASAAYPRPGELAPRRAATAERAERHGQRGDRATPGASLVWRTGAPPAVRINKLGGRPADPGWFSAGRTERARS